MLPARVLMVDDDVLYTRRTRLALGEVVELRVVRTRSEALAIAECWVPDLVVLELFVGDSDAFRLLDELRNRQPLSPLSIIYLTKGPGSSTRFQNDGHTFLGMIQRESGIERLHDAIVAATRQCRLAAAA